MSSGHIQVSERSSRLPLRSDPYCQKCLAALQIHFKHCDRSTSVSVEATLAMNHWHGPVNTEFPKHDTSSVRARSDMARLRICYRIFQKTRPWRLAKRRCAVKMLTFGLCPSPPIRHLGQCLSPPRRPVTNDVCGAASGQLSATKSVQSTWRRPYR